jgi:beta-glucosidase/6-phospho-beta-glucosidase/beta-galactosidase
MEVIANVTETPAEIYVINLMRNCAEICMDFASRNKEVQPYETYVSLVQICALKCLRFAREWELNSPSRVESLKASIWACSVCAEEFRRINERSLDNYVQIFEECSHNGLKLLK